MTVLAPPDALAQWRRDTPACAARVHLNNAGSSLMPQPVADTVFGHLRLEMEIGGYEAEDAAAGAIQGAYENVARLLGCEARNVAMVENATVAFALALSAFDFQPGDVLVTTRGDYTSNILMYLALARRRGVEVLYAEDLPEGGVDPDSLRQLARHRRCRLVAVTWVPTNSGLVQDAEAIGGVCEELSVPYLLDACQAVGQLPIDLSRLRCDYLAATARKFLRGPRGIGFLYVSDKALERADYPLAVDMRGAEKVGGHGFKLADSAKRFENWEFPWALVLGMGEAARYALEVGIAEGGGRAAELAAYVREKVAALPGVRIADRGARLCAIVTAEVEGNRELKPVVRGLRERGINIHAVSRQDDPAVPLLRISPHYYNTREEVDAMAAALGELLGKG